MPFRVGIIGTGWGVRAQVPQFRQAGLEITAICSRSLERARSVAEEHGIPHAFDSVEALVACEAVDLVSICTPTHERKAAVLKAIAAGRHVLTEKPMALSFEEAVEMFVAAEAAPKDRLHLMDFELRCVPALRQARTFIDGGDIGQVQFVTFSCVGNFGFLEDGATFGHWNSRECGGGVFSAVGTHYVDCCRYLLSQEVGRVSAIELPLQVAMPDEEGNPQPVTAEGYVTAQLVMTDGTPVHITVSGKTPGAGMYENRMVIVGSSGTIMFSFMNAELKVWLSGADPSEGPTMTMGPEEGNAWSKVGTPELGRAILLALTGEKGNAEMEPLGKESLASFNDGVHVQKVTDAVHQSASEHGAWVTVEYSLPVPK